MDASSVKTQHTKLLIERKNVKSMGIVQNW